MGHTKQSPIHRPVDTWNTDITYFNLVIRNQDREVVEGVLIQLGSFAETVFSHYLFLFNTENGAKVSTPLKHAVRGGHRKVY